MTKRMWDKIAKTDGPLTWETIPPPKAEIGIGEPIRLIPGSVYVIQSDIVLSKAAKTKLIGYLYPFKVEYEIDFLILDSPLKLAIREKDEISSNL